MSYHNFNNSNKNNQSNKKVAHWPYLNIHCKIGTKLCSLIIMIGISFGFTRMHPHSHFHSQSIEMKKHKKALFNAEAQIYLGFESSAEPYETMPPREPDPNGTGNGCMGGEAWNEYYKFNVCVSPTSPLSDYALERSSQYARYGGTSLRCYLKPTDLNSWPQGEATHRAELAPHHNSPVPRYPLEGEEMWYGISYFFPSDFVFAPSAIENDIRFIIAQWQHGSPGSPIIALEVMGDNIVLQRQGGQSENPTWYNPESIATIQRGQWMDIVIQAQWSKNNGLVNIWVNGNLTYAKSNIQTIYSNLNNGGGFKIGLYYWRWKYMQSVINSLNAGITYREIFIDEVREYHGTEGYTAVAPGAPALPIELLSFNAQVTNNSQVDLKWQTASELNNEEFKVQRSPSGLHWQEIASIDGAGTSEVLRTYNATDLSPLPGTSFYRLKQIDYDGQFSFSQVRSITLNGLNNVKVRLYPNPVTKQLIIEAPESELDDIEIYGTLGQVMTLPKPKVQSSDNRMILNLGPLPSGIYTIRTKTTSHQIFKE